MIHQMYHRDIDGRQFGTMAMPATPAMVAATPAQLSELVMGSLLALKPDFDIAALSTEPAQILAQALKDYGGYVVR